MESMKEVMVALECWGDIMQAIDKLYEQVDETGMLSVLCMAIDYCATKCGRQSVDVIDKLRPQIETVNLMFGPIR